MKKFCLIAILMVSVLVAVAGCSSKASSPQPAPPSLPAPSQSLGSRIEITASGSSPPTITVKQGDTVTFVNKDTAAHWPASALHPTHTLYPGTGIQKCGTAEQPNIFDACGGLQQGEAFKFKFDNKGTWKYHDHLNPSLWGTIVVK